MRSVGNAPWIHSSDGQNVHKPPPFSRMKLWIGTQVRCTHSPEPPKKQSADPQPTGQCEHPDVPPLRDLSLRIFKLNYRKKTMSTINGIGFKFIGQSDPKRDGSYVATKWFCLVFPLIPVGSYRIWPGDHKSYALGMYSSSTFQLKPVGLYLPHVVKIYGMYLALYLFIVVADRMGSGQWHFK